MTKVTDSEVEYIKIRLARSKDHEEIKKLREELVVKETLLYKQHNDMLKEMKNDGQRMA